MLSLMIAWSLQAMSTPPGEEAVAPYQMSNSNAGATPVAGGALWRAFHGEMGVSRIVDDLVARSVADPRISDIFKSRDLVRLRRTLKEQFCYIIGGGCAYSGRDMRTSHEDLGIQQADMAALVENLQASMRHEHVPFAAQNRFLAKLAPMRRDIVVR